METLDPAIEQGYYPVTVAFTDEDGNAATPSAITYTLTDLSGTIINDIDQKPFTPLASTILIPLKGQDLELFDSDWRNERVLLVEATVTTSYGADLPFKKQVTIPIENLVGVPDT